jgi:hypothetical protein
MYEEAVEYATPKYPIVKSRLLLYFWKFGGVAFSGAVDALKNVTPNKSGVINMGKRDLG